MVEPWQLYPDDPRINDDTFWNTDSEDLHKEDLNKIDMGYVGYSKPKVIVVYENTERDNDPADPNENWEEEIHED